MREMERVLSREVAHAEAGADAQDDLLAKAAAGGPFWSEGKAPVAESQIVGLGAFAIESDPPDLAERQADRVAMHQRREAARAGWSGDNWFWCGCAGEVGSCLKATCTNHRMSGMNDAELRELRELGRAIHAVGGMPSSLPIGRSFTIIGSWRVYFNQHAAAPLVWCVAPADGSWEIAVSMVQLDIRAATIHRPGGPEPRAWIAVDGQLTVSITGLASIGVPDGAAQ